MIAKILGVALIKCNWCKKTLAQTSDKNAKKMHEIITACYPNCCSRQ